MADQVQVLLEGMVGELEELRRKKVLSGEEIKAVLKRRRRFEFNVRKADTSSAEYLRYVDYERHLHLLLNRRCDQLALKRCGAIRFMGVERCRGLLERATRRFPAELQLWRAFIEFCLECCLDGPLGALFGRALQVHPLSAEFWIQAAMWEYVFFFFFSLSLSLSSLIFFSLPNLKISSKQKHWCSKGVIPKSAESDSRSVCGVVAVLPAGNAVSGHHPAADRRAGSGVSRGRAAGPRGCGGP
ncbi:MAG: hypothetical protein Q8P67_23395, partial [archaeon]|nr:hypothetical protein [archaeon]